MTRVDEPSSFRRPRLQAVQFVNTSTTTNTKKVGLPTRSISATMIPAIRLTVRRRSAAASHLKSPWRRRHRPWSPLEQLFSLVLLSVLVVQIAPAVRLIGSGPGSNGRRSTGAISSGSIGVSEFRLPGNHSVNLTHIIVNPTTGHLFAGATNVIMEFNENLTLVRSVATGPEWDHEHCPPTNCNGTGYKTRPTNTINKVLLIDEESRKLIVCGSTHQGACQRMELNDITDKEPIVPIPVATNDENSSSFAMIGPAKYGDVQQRMLYVATTRTRYGTYSDIRPAISGRSLEQGDLFSILEHSFSTIARVDLGTTVKDYYLVSYVYGFHTDDYVYFATVQMRSHLLQLQELGYNSRLARLCAGDPSFNTYTEISLVCKGADGTDYNLLQDATVVEAGSDLARSLGLRDERRIFVGAFAQSVDHTTKVSGRSAICIYPLRQIEKMFTENIHMCYNGTVATRNMDYVAGSLADCPAPGKSGNVYSFCNETLKVNGSAPIRAQAAATWTGVTLTAVVVTVTQQHSVAFLGTNHGTVKKVLLSAEGIGEEFEEVEVDHPHSILADMMLSIHGDFVYAASPYKVSTSFPSRHIAH
ncbi:plexin-B-like [Varroa jacobsoni]|uniref:plexin-B-like n=1 Tax=Varroa jacobsoni TaxID=62625 RepID=UPI000BF3419D|nr:plexin-B-like [Varroa jacobsoni]